jgi:hypothetical protein
MPLPLVVAIVAGIAVMAVLAVRREIGMAKRKAELLVARGFRPLEQPEPEVAGPLLQLYRRGPARNWYLQLWKPFHRDHRGGGMYVFGVMAPKRRRGGRIVASSVGVIRRGAGLPPFEVYAMSEQGGPMGKFVVPLLTGALGQGRVIPFDDLPEFSRRFTVLSPVEGGEEAVREYLTPALREALLQFQFFTLLAEGDAFALHANTLSRSGRGDDIGALARLIDEASEVARVLEEAPRSSGALARGP